MDSAAPSPAPGLTVAAVARHLGVAPDTLRTWDRRYGLGPAEHRAGAHRRYSMADLARLEQVRRLINAGMQPGDSARVVLDSALVSQLESVPITVQALTDLRLAPSTEQFAPSTASARGLARAAAAMDSGACRAIINEHLGRNGVVWTWETLLAPTLIGIGEQWQSSGRVIEVEHLLTQVIESCIGTVTDRLRAPINVRPVLLAAAPDELHALVLTALAGALAERHIEVRLLGPRVPTAALLRAARRCGPVAVFVWSQITETGDVIPLAGLLKIRPVPAVVIGGPGWAGPTPPGVKQVYGFAEAVSKIARIVGE